MTSLNNYMRKKASSIQARPAMVDPDSSYVKPINTDYQPYGFNEYDNWEQPPFKGQDITEHYLKNNDSTLNTHRVSQNSQNPMLPDVFAIEDTVPYKTPYNNGIQVSEGQRVYKNNRTPSRLFYDDTDAGNNFASVPAIATTQYKAEQPHTYPWADLMGGTPEWRRESSSIEDGMRSDIYGTDAPKPEEFNQWQKGYLPHQPKNDPNGVLAKWFGASTEPVPVPGNNQVKVYDTNTLYAATHPHVGDSMDAQRMLEEKRKARAHPESQLGPISRGIAVDANMKPGTYAHETPINNGLANGNSSLIFTSKGDGSQAHAQKVMDQLTYILNTPANMKTVYEPSEDGVQDVAYGKEGSPDANKLSHQDFYNTLSKARALGQSMYMDMDNGANKDIRGNYEKAIDILRGDKPIPEYLQNTRDTIKANLPADAPSSDYLKNVNDATLRGVVQKKNPTADMSKMANLTKLAAIVNKPKSLQDYLNSK